MNLPPIFGYIRRFGFWRGLEFRAVAAKCDKDPHLLQAWSNHYNARASREFRHGNNYEGRVYQAFAEMLRSTYDTLVLKRKPRRPFLTKNQRRLERALKRRMEAKKAARK